MATKNTTEDFSFSEENVHLLACPVCFEVPTVNQIYQCENGHNICIDCYEKLVEVGGTKNCLQCRKEMFKTRYIDFVKKHVHPR